MKRKWLPLLLLPAIAAGYLALQNNPAGETPASSPTIEPATVTETVTPPSVDSPTFTPTFEGCYYNWAYKDLPELTEKVNSAIRALDPDASAYAQAFGEDCIYADGHSTFGAMETDFYIRLPAAELSDEEAFGNWIGQVMPVVLNLPPDEVPGPTPGSVEFRFTKSDVEQIIVRVPIRQYREAGAGKTGVELFRWFYIPQTSPT
jgi:hypothetical protein